MSTLALKSVKGVLFDAVGTLIHPEPSVAQAYLQAGARYGSQLDEATIAEKFRAAMAGEDEADALLHRGRTSEQREQLRWRRIVMQVFNDVADRKQLFDDLWRHFAAPTSWRLDPEAPAVLDTLRQRGYVLGIASNFDARLEKICEVIEPLQTCRVFASSTLGWRKPSPEFFRAIEERLNLRPDELLLVGDDVANDYDAARAAGWRALLIDRTGTRDGAIHSLADVPSALDRT